MSEKKKLTAHQIEVNRDAALSKESGLDGDKMFVYVQKPDGNYRRVFSTAVIAETRTITNIGITESEYAEICKEPQEGEDLNATYSWRLHPSF